MAGIGCGLIVVYGLLTGKRLDNWTAIFLTTTFLTSPTEFLFPVEHPLPSHVVGAISLVRSSRQPSHRGSPVVSNNVGCVDT